MMLMMMLLMMMMMMMMMRFTVFQYYNMLRFYMPFCAVSQRFSSPGLSAMHGMWCPSTPPCDYIVGVVTGMGRDGWLFDKAPGFPFVLGEVRSEI